MDPVFDGAGGATLNCDGVTVQKNWTQPAGSGGSDDACFIFLGITDPDHNGGAVTSVKANGVDATKIGSKFNESAVSADQVLAEVWRAVGIPSGSFTVQVNTSAPLALVGFSYRAANVDQGTPNGPVALGEGEDAAPTSQIPGTIAGSLLLDFMVQDGTTGVSPGAGQTQRLGPANASDAHPPIDPAGQQSADGSEKTAVGGDATMSWAIAGGIVVGWVTIAFEIFAPSLPPSARARVEFAGQIANVGSGPLMSAVTGAVSTQATGEGEISDRETLAGSVVAGAGGKVEGLD